MRLLVDSNTHDFPDHGRTHAAGLVVLALDDEAAATFGQQQVGPTIGTPAPRFDDLIAKTAEGLPNQKLEFLPGHGLERREVALP